MAAGRIFRTSLFTSSLLALGLATGCGGGATPEPEAPPAEEPDAPEHAYEDEEDISDDEAALLAQIEESAAAADDAAAEASGEDGDGPAKREVVYRVSPESIKVQIEGAEFVPTAEAVRVNGGWGVKLTVKATTDSDKVLWSSPNGPLAFGGAVTRGAREKFGDKRGGGSEVALSPGPAIEFDRTWPAEGEKGLGPGDELELHVGLWGFGSSAENRRPVNRFIVVKMKGGKKPEPIIQPPG
jgi:hypothetical protein